MDWDTHVDVSVLIYQLSNETHSIIHKSTSTTVPQSRIVVYSYSDTFTIGRNKLAIHFYETSGIPKQINVHRYDPTLGSVRVANMFDATFAYNFPR